MAAREGEAWRQPVDPEVGAGPADPILQPLNHQPFGYHGQGKQQRPGGRAAKQQPERCSASHSQGRISPAERSNPANQSGQPRPIGTGLGELLHQSCCDAVVRPSDYRHRNKQGEQKRWEQRLGNDGCHLAALNEVLPLHPNIATMDQSSASQNRKNRRSNVLMSASLELSGTSLPVKLRNLSAEGALVEGDGLPIEGASILFRKG